jgi:hypothetical protein
VRRSRSIQSIGTSLAAITAATVLAGCGGGHSASRSDVVAQANAICFEAQQTMRSIPAPTGGSETLAVYLDKITPIVAREAKKLAKLPRPSERQNTLNRFIDASSALVADYHAAASAATAGDDDGVQQALAKLRASPVAHYAHQYGLGQCAGATHAPR